MLIASAYRLQTGTFLSAIPAKFSAPQWYIFTSLFTLPPFYRYQLINLLRKTPFPSTAGYIVFRKIHAHHFNAVVLKHNAITQSLILGGYRAKISKNDHKPSLLSE